MDYGKWGFWVSVIALLSSFPLAILGTLLAPRISIWRSERSVASAQRRLDRLRSELEMLQQTDTETNFKIKIVSIIRKIAVISFGIMAILVIYLIPQQYLGAGAKISDFTKFSCAGIIYLLSFYMMGRIFKESMSIKVIGAPLVEKEIKRIEGFIEKRLSR